AALLRREGFWIAVDPHHVLVTRQRPEAGAIATLTLPRHRRPRAQPRKHFVGLAVGEARGFGANLLAEPRKGFRKNGAGLRRVWQRFAQQQHRHSSDRLLPSELDASLLFDRTLVCPRVKSKPARMRALAFARREWHSTEN